MDRKIFVKINSEDDVKHCLNILKLNKEKISEDENGKDWYKCPYLKFDEDDGWVFSDYYLKEQEIDIDNFHKYFIVDEINYINLTDGIEWISDISNPRFIRIQSTTIENKYWEKLFLDLDHDLLMNLAIGKICNIYDCGTNKPCSKAIYTGVEVIKYCLNRYWYGMSPEKVERRLRNGEYSKESNIQPYFNNLYKMLFIYDSTKEKEAVKTKLIYYKKFLNSDKVNIFGFSKSTANDGNYPYFKEKLIKHYGISKEL